MEPLDFGDLPEDALILIDSAPIIYFLEGAPEIRTALQAALRSPWNWAPALRRNDHHHAEVLTGPLQAADDALARRYRAILESWQPIALDVDIAESAARLRAVAPPQACRRCSSG